MEELESRMHEMKSAGGRAGDQSSVEVEAATKQALQEVVRMREGVSWG